jgi:hypothetical protein
MRDLPDTEQDFHPSQHDILCSVPRMSAIKKTCLRAGREDNRGATRRSGRDFSLRNNV